MFWKHERQSPPGVNTISGKFKRRLGAQRWQRTPPTVAVKGTALKRAAFVTRPGTKIKAGAYVTLLKEPDPCALPFRFGSERFVRGSSSATPSSCILLLQPGTPAALQVGAGLFGFLKSWLFFPPQKRRTSAGKV